MKYVLEFGVRGAAYCDNMVIPTRKLAIQLARSVAYVFDAGSTWIPTMRADCPRQSWNNNSHFVSLSRLDGQDRGPASAKLWRKS